jgi:hypothetical protein
MSTMRADRGCTATDYRSIVDRDAMARNPRRRQVGEVLDDERGREAALAERLEEVVAEADGMRIDEQVFERLDPEDVTVVRELFQTTTPFDDEEEADTFDLEIESEPPDGDWADAEIARLQNEIAHSRRRQLAYQRYLDALDA